MAITIISASIALQLGAAYLLFQLIRITGERRAWLLVLLAIFLMAVRRTVSLYRLLTDSNLHRPDLNAEFLAVTISALLLIGIAGISPVFRSIKRSEHFVRDFVESTSAHRGTEFFRSVVERLASVLSIRGALLVELRAGEADAQVLAAWKDGAYVDGPPMSADNDLFAHADGDDIVHVTDAKGVKWPDDEAGMGIASYLAAPLVNSAGERMGFLLAVHDGALPEPAFATACMSVMATRARDEIENKRVHEQLKDSREYMQKLAVHLQSAQEDERAHVAREIHDELGQSLSVLKMNLAEVERECGTCDKNFLPYIRTAGELIDSSVRTVHSLVAGLRPGLLDDLGLAAAIEWHVNDFAQKTGLVCSVDAQERGLYLDADRSTALYRICQEVLTNVVRHAQATTVNVLLKVKGKTVVLQVDDDGCGIKEHEIYARDRFGLSGIRERLSIWGGECQIMGSDSGTTVRATMSLDAGKKEASAHDADQEKTPRGI